MSMGVSLLRTSQSLLTGLTIPQVRSIKGYIVYAFSVIMFVCLSVNFFSVKDFSATTIGASVLKFCVHLQVGKVYCVNGN